MALTQTRLLKHDFPVHGIRDFGNVQGPTRKMLLRKNIIKQGFGVCLGLLGAPTWHVKSGPGVEHVQLWDGHMLSYGMRFPD